jgi:hypothetical protein
MVDASPPDTLPDARPAPAAARPARPAKPSRPAKVEATPAAAQKKRSEIRMEDL